MGCIFASSIGLSEPRATKPTGHAHTYGRQEVDGKGWASVKYHSFRTLHNTAQTFDSKVSFENSSYVDDSLIFSEIVCEFASASICERKGPNFRA